VFSAAKNANSDKYNKTFNNQNNKCSKTKERYTNHGKVRHLIRGKIILCFDVGFVQPLVFINVKVIVTRLFDEYTNKVIKNFQLVFNPI